MPATDVDAGPNRVICARPRAWLLTRLPSPSRTSPIPGLPVWPGSSMAIRVTRKGFVQRVSTRDEVAELATSPVCSRDAGRSVHLLSWWLASQFLLQDVGRAGPASAAAAGGGAPADPVVFRGV